MQVNNVSMFEPFACTCQEQSVSFILQAASNKRLARVRRGAKRSVIDGHRENSEHLGTAYFGLWQPYMACTCFRSARLANIGRSVN